VHEECRTLLNYTCFIRHINHCEAQWAPYGEAWELLVNTAPEQLPALDAAQAWLSKGLLA